MKERQILMNGWSVRSILNGHKTQTRRVIKPQPKIGDEFIVWTGRKKWGDACVSFTTREDSFRDNLARHCPYGIPGDRLWVRETWASYAEYDDAKPSEIPVGERVFFVADHNGKWKGSRVRPSIFMCRWMSRILLEITDVHAQRVQDISDDDVTAEGLPYRKSTDDFAIGRSPADGKWYWGFPTPAWNGGIDYVYSRDAQCAFQNLWDSINGGGDFSWEHDPWVWVVEFKRIEPAD